MAIFEEEKKQNGLLVFMKLYHVLPGKKLSWVPESTCVSEAGELRSSGNIGIKSDSLIQLEVHM